MGFSKLTLTTIVTLSEDELGLGVALIKKCPLVFFSGSALKLLIEGIVHDIKKPHNDSVIPYLSLPMADCLLRDALLLLQLFPPRLPKCHAKRTHPGLPH